MRSSRSSLFLPLNDAIRIAFEEEIRAFGGNMVQAFDDSRLLFLSARLPALSGETRPRDRIQGGVALRTRGPEVLVHPYLYRLICQNGAVSATAMETRCVERPEFGASAEAEWQAIQEVREAIRLCASPAAFQEGLGRMRSSADITEASFLLRILPLLARGSGFSSTLFERFLSTIEERYSRGKDRSAYGLVNAITSTARDTHDPESRWRLEEMGGGVLAMALRPKPELPSARAPAFETV